MHEPKSALDSLRAKINESLRSSLPFSDMKNKVIEAMRYAVLAPGKRIRPILMLEIARILRHDQEAIVPSACAIEFIHTASLILDDLPCMDNAVLRRGQNATHLVFGEAIAILAAIALILHAFNLIQGNALHAEIGKEEMGKMFLSLYQKTGLEGMITGQNFDLSSPEIPFSVVHAYKTTSLFEIAIETACVLCQATEAERKSLTRYGVYLGDAFQMADDVLDMKANGLKDSHRDAGKKTYARMYGMDKAKEEVKKMVQSAQEELRFFEDHRTLYFLAWTVYEQIEENMRHEPHES